MKEEPQGDLKHLPSATDSISPVNVCPRRVCFVLWEVNVLALSPSQIRRSPCPGVPGLTWYKEVAPWPYRSPPEFRSACDLGPKRIGREVAHRVRLEITLVK